MKLKVIASSKLNAIKLNQLTPTEEKKVMAKYETFLSRSLFFYTTNMNEIGKTNTRRLLFLLSMKVCAIFIMTKSIVYIVRPTSYIRDLTCNGYHYIGDPFLINLLVIFGSLLGHFGHGPLHLYNNLLGQSRMFWFMHKIKNRRMKYKLNNHFNRKFYRRLNVIAMSANKVLIPSWLLLCVVIGGTNIIGFFDDQLNFSLIGKVLCFNINFKRWVCK